MKKTEATGTRKSGRFKGEVVLIGRIGHMTMHMKDVSKVMNLSYDALSKEDISTIVQKDV